MPSVEPTELLDIKVIRQDGVKNPASGFPILVMKSAAAKDADDVGCGCCDACESDLTKAVNAVGGIDEKPEIAGAQHILVELGKLIQGEAAELAAGSFDETYDIQMLLEATCLMRCFLDNEMWGDEDDGGMMKSADGLVFKAHRKFSSDERKSLASEGKALPDGSYPIPDEDALHRAAILARSGHGDVAAAKRLIAKRAKELGVANPLASDNAQKDAHEGTDLPDVRTADSDLQADGLPEAAPEGVTKTSEPEGSEGQDELAQKIEKALAEATSARERTEALEAELAVLKATPIPGGPMLTATAAQRDERAKSDRLAKAAHFRRQASLVQDRELIKHYVEKAKALEAEA